MDQSTLPEEIHRPDRFSLDPFSHNDPHALYQYTNNVMATTLGKAASLVARLFRVSKTISTRRSHSNLKKKGSHCQVSSHGTPRHWNQDPTLHRLNKRHGLMHRITPPLDPP